MKKIRIAFIKYCGLTAGGTEKFLQTIAANLNKERFDVHYYYTDTAPLIGASHTQPPISPEREAYMRAHDVKLMRVEVEAVDLTKRTHPWVNTNLFEKFHESDFDIIQTGRAGHPEFPFTHIRKTPIVDSLHLLAGVDNQYNIARVMHITDWSRKIWEWKGGDATRSVLVSHPIEIQDVPFHSLRNELGIEGKTILGFHQRNDPAIFSSIPLAAYKTLENDSTHFIILGGSDKHRLQAAELGITNITFLDHTADTSRIYSFLATLDIYAHGRKDGEVNSTAMAEAMYFGCPILSHISDINNGHIECIADAGYVADNESDYALHMRQLIEDISYRETCSQNAHRRFAEKYDLRAQIRHIESIYEDVIRNPFPHKIRRRISTFKLWRVCIYFPIRLVQLTYKKYASR